MLFLLLLGLAAGGDDWREQNQQLQAEVRAWNSEQRAARRDWKTWDEGERQRFLDLLVRQRVLKAWRYYELSEDQRLRVENRLRERAQAQMEYFKRIEPELRRLSDLEPQPKENAEPPRQVPTDVNRDLRRLWAGGPFTQPRQINAIIEQEVPPAQVEIAHKRNTARGDRRARLIYEEYLRSIPYDPQMRPTFSHLAAVENLPGCDLELYVEMFIRCYQLDAGQQAAARSALREAIAARQKRQGYSTTRPGEGTLALDDDGEQLPPEFAKLITDLKSLLRADQKGWGEPTTAPASAPASQTSER